MAAASVDIKDMLVADSSLELVYGTNLFIGREPTAPINSVTIFDSPGRLSISMDVSKYEYPSVQIRVRNAKYLDAMDIAQAIMDSLVGNSGVWNGKRYHFVTCSLTPSLLDYDERNNARIITSYELQRSN